MCLLGSPRKSWSRSFGQRSWAEAQALCEQTCQPELMEEHLLGPRHISIAKYTAQVHILRL